MKFLEMLPIALAICVWYKEFHKKKILFHVDDMAVVSILNYMSTKSDRVLKVVTFLKISCPLRYLNYAISLAIENNTIFP
jgi:hypothetical protein